MNHAVTIRRATHADLDTIVAFNAAMAEETEGRSLNRKVLAAGVQRALQDATLCAYYVAEVDARAVGQTMVTHEWSDWRNGLFWWIQSVYVAPSHRRRGVFRALYAHVRSLARAEDHVRGLRLYVIRKNRPALATYLRLGMTESDYVLCEEDWSHGASPSPG